MEAIYDPNRKNDTRYGGAIILKRMWDYLDCDRLLHSAGIQKRSGVPASCLAFNYVLKPMMDAGSIKRANTRTRGDQLLQALIPGHDQSTLNRFLNGDHDWEAIVLVEKYNGIHGLAKMVDPTNEHTLFAPIPIDNTFVKNVEKTIREGKGDPNYTLNVKVAAVYTQLPVTALEKVQNEENVFLVDVGPIDVADAYKEFYKTQKLGQTLDVYHKQLKYC